MCTAAYISHIEKSSSWRQNIEWLQGLEEERMESCLMRIEVQFCKIKCSGDWLHNIVSDLGATELHT